MDIIELTDVSDVYNVSLGHDVHEFVIRQRHGAAIYFNSEDRDAIVKVQSLLFSQSDTSLVFCRRSKTLEDDYVDSAWWALTT
jgi:hypothetical protein